MRSLWIIGALGCGLLAFGQRPARPARPVRAAQPPAQIFREIDDPSTGTHWLLERDPRLPGGPGRLIAVASLSVQGRGNRNANPAAWPLPVIRAGDRVILEENTPLVQARLAALALNPAQAGAPLRVRLEIGGRVLRAVALRPGHAQLAPNGNPEP